MADRTGLAAVCGTQKPKRDYLLGYAQDVCAPTGAPGQRRLSGRRALFANAPYGTAAAAFAAMHGVDGPPSSPPSAAWLLGTTPTRNQSLATRMAVGGPLAPLEVAPDRTTRLANLRFEAIRSAPHAEGDWHTVLLSTVATRLEVVFTGIRTQATGGLSYAAFDGEPPVASRQHLGVVQVDIERIGRAEELGVVAARWHGRVGRRRWRGLSRDERAVRRVVGVERVARRVVRVVCRGVPRVRWVVRPVYRVGLVGGQVRRGGGRGGGPGGETEQPQKGCVHDEASRRVLRWPGLPWAKRATARGVGCPAVHARQLVGASPHLAAHPGPGPVYGRAAHWPGALRDLARPPGRSNPSRRTVR